MAEAKKAVAPFKLEFKQCDWFTLYVGVVPSALRLTESC
jgi:hypothetical protein